MVQSWLLNHGIETTALNSTGDWFNVHLPVRKAETLLDTTYSVYAHNDGSTLVRAPEWSLPENLHQHIDLVQPTTSFFRTTKQTVDTKPERGPIDWHQPHGKQWWKAAPDHVGLRNAVFSSERSDQDDDCSTPTSHPVRSAQCAISLVPTLQVPLSPLRLLSVYVACMGQSITHQERLRKT
jgi:hypothetical protein